VAACGLFVSACSSVSVFDRDAQEKLEYFSESKYGSASPRVIKPGQRVPKGGGRYQVGKPYTIAGRTFVPKEDPNYSQRGKASWYGAAFHGRKTANGEVYDMDALTAAHPTLPLPSYVRVTNLDNGRSLVVRVNDRGPFAHGRIIDLSKAAALKLGYKGQGTANVQVDYVGLARMDGKDHRMLMASYAEPGKPGRGITVPAARGPVQVASTPTPRPPAPAAPAADPLAPLILNGGYMTFAPVENFDATAAHRAASQLIR